MRLRLLAASVTLVALSASTWRVHAQQSSQARGATPLTMGQLALLLATPDSTLGASLRTALQSSDAGVRAIAARIVDVSLDVSAIVAVTQWHYEPALVQGTPRMVEDTIYVHFALQ